MSKKELKKELMQSKSVHLPVSFWERLDALRGAKEWTASQLIREIIGKHLKGTVDTVPEIVLPLTMFAPCGDPAPLGALSRPFDDTSVNVRGVLADAATKGAFVAIAQCAERNSAAVDGICHGDRVLMIPVEDWEGQLSPSLIVLTQITYTDGAEPMVTLKKYADVKVFEANITKNGGNGDSKIKSLTPLAICAGVLEKQFI